MGQGERGAGAPRARKRCASYMRRPRRRARPAERPGGEGEGTVFCLSVTVRRGILAAAVLAGVTMLAAAGCAPTAAPESASTTTAHDLTIAEAQAAYHDYLTVSDAAAAQGNQAQGQSNVAFEQWALVHTQYTALEAQGTPVPRYQYGPPVFYVPAEAGYPQWFMVAVPRTTLVSGHPGATVNTLMVFERPKAG